MYLNEDLVQTTSNEDREGCKIIQRALDGAQEYGLTDGNRGDLEKPEDLWRELMQVIGVLV